MDGTILTSIAAVERAWTAWATRVSVSRAEVLDYMHGRRAADTIGRFMPAGTDMKTELAWLNRWELDDLEGVAEVPGAGAFLRSLPAECWAVVTSATRSLAMRRIATAGLPEPRLLVTSDDVARGKPDPECFLLAARRLNVMPADCLVFEDARAGIMAGLAAGADVLQVAGTHDPGGLPVVRTITDYRQMSLRTEAEGLRIFFGAGQTRVAAGVDPA